MDMQVLRPIHDILEAKGKMYYEEGAQAWSLMRLRKELLLEFPQLKEKRSDFYYKAVLFNSYKILEKALKEMQKKDEPVPLLLFFYKKPDTEQS